MTRAVPWLARVVLGAQIVAVAVGPWTGGPSLWAPFHEHGIYRVEAELDGRLLTPDELVERYGVYGRDDVRRALSDGLELPGWETNRLQDVLDRVAREEARRPEGDRARVRVVYRVNGRPPVEWRAP